MPTFKHPCPHCAKYVARDVAACPYCGTADPFAPARCANCRAVIEDPAWISCPRCGQSLAKPEAQNGQQQPSGQPPTVQTPAVKQPTAQPPRAQAAPAAAATAGASRKCSGCAAPLPDGARFCTVCGTLAD